MSNDESIKLLVDAFSPRDRLALKEGLSSFPRIAWFTEEKEEFMESPRLKRLLEEPITPLIGGVIVVFTPLIVEFIVVFTPPMEFMPPFTLPMEFMPLPMEEFMPLPMEEFMPPLTPERGCVAGLRPSFSITSGRFGSRRSFLDPSIPHHRARTVQGSIIFSPYPKTLPREWRLYSFFSSLGEALNGPSPFPLWLAV